MKEEKNRLRMHFQAVRKEISEKRKRDARNEIFISLFPRLKDFHCVLSYESLPMEVDMSLVNQMLLEEGKLALPKIRGDHITPYLIESLENDVRQFSHHFLEPDPMHCKVAKKVDCILVPGVAFDLSLNRLGFGKGYYDKFIEVYPGVTILGVLYKEQLYNKTLPVEAHDRKVGELCIV